MVAIGARMIGAALAAPPPAAPHLPYKEIDTRAVLADFARRLADLEKAVTLSVPGDRITSMIAVTSDTALISAEKIAMIGEVTFADWHRDVTGQATPVLDPSITQIRGGVIRTGTVANLSGTSYINLDAVTTGQVFLQCASALTIMGDGQATFGASTGKQLKWNNIDLSIDNNVLLGSTTVGTVVSGAAAGAAYPGDFTASILAASGTAITVTSSNLFTMPGSGSGGVFIGAGGLYGKNSAGTVKFSLDATTGLMTAVDGIFSGSLSAATGTFAGDITTTGHVHATGEYTGSGTYPAAVSGIVSGASSTGLQGINTHSTSTSAIGVYGESAKGIGVRGFNGTGWGMEAGASGPGGIGLYAWANGASGTGAKIQAWGSATLALDVLGTSSFSGQIASTVATGTAPLSIASQSMCANLYANWGDSSRTLFAQSGGGWGSDWMTLGVSPVAADTSTATQHVKVVVNGSTLYLLART